MNYSKISYWFTGFRVEFLYQSFFAYCDDKIISDYIYAFSRSQFTLLNSLAFTPRLVSFDVF